MTVETYLSCLPGGWYPTAPSRASRYLRYSIKGPVWGHMDTDIVELESRRGKTAVMLVRPVTRQTEKKRGGRWRVRFFSNSLEEAFKHYPCTHNRTAVAFHEAGHAVVASKLGFSYKAVMLETHSFFCVNGKLNQKLGSVTYADKLPRSIENAIITIAGPLAEYSQTKEFVVEGSDLESFHSCTKNSEQALSAMEHARQVLLDNWDEVFKLAYKLLFLRTIHMTPDTAPDREEQPKKEASA